MLRTVFFLLVLANLLLFAWTQGYFGVPADGREPQRLNNQLAPEKLRVIGSGASSAQSEQNCRLVTGVALSEFQRLLPLAKEKYPELRLALKLNDAPKNIYWLLIPPLGNKLAADKKSAELKKLEIPAFTLILDEGPDQFAILLGAFNSELAAGEYLRELAKRGVRSAKVQARENPLDKAQLEVRGPPDLVARQLAELLQSQAAAKAGDCPTAR
ncbi:MAG: hypothetical protein D4S02_18275 [Rhodocyclaceae bacterium]|nr:MAG: hypothetical protein D4S02_18275 [Rhodocyclaceae bacterium]